MAPEKTVDEKTMRAEFEAEWAKYCRVAGLSPVSTDPEEREHYSKCYAEFRDGWNHAMIDTAYAAGYAAFKRSVVVMGEFRQRLQSEKP